MDPGAVPGTSTINNHGGEIGSTGIERYFLLLGMVPTLWNKIITANDNSREMAIAA